MSDFSWTNDNIKTCSNKSDKVQKMEQRYEQHQMITKFLDFGVKHGGTVFLFLWRAALNSQTRFSRALQPDPELEALRMT